MTKAEMRRAAEKRSKERQVPASPLSSLAVAATAHSSPGGFDALVFVSPSPLRDIASAGLATSTSRAGGKVDFSPVFDFGWRLGSASSLRRSKNAPHLAKTHLKSGYKIPSTTCSDRPMLTAKVHLQHQRSSRWTGIRIQPNRVAPVRLDSRSNAVPRVDMAT